MITRLNIGGPARQALLLTKALEDDYPTTLVAGYAPDYEGELSDPQVTVTRVALVRRPSPAQDLRALRESRQLMRQLKPAIVHTHMAKAGAIGRFAGSSHRPRPLLVHTYHGHVLSEYFRPTIQKVAIRAEQMLARRSDILIAISPEIKDQLLALEVGEPEQYRVIPLGIELDHLLVDHSPGELRHQLGLSESVPLVGTIGRLAAIKNLPMLFEAIRLIPDCHLAVLGDGELRPTLEELCVKLGIAERVHFTGWWMDLPSAFADLDVVALSSLNEGTPVALIEAAAAARAVVATNVGGVPSVVTDGVTGNLVPSGDSAAMAEKLNALLSNEKLRQQMGAAARTDIPNRFSSRRLLADVRALYAEMLDSE